MHRDDHRVPVVIVGGGSALVVILGVLRVVGDDLLSMTVGLVGPGVGAGICFGLGARRLNLRWGRSWLRRVGATGAGGVPERKHGGRTNSAEHTAGARQTWG